ncbi:MAG: hypothetical protein KGN84_17505 [Acidobacteriota bacterium]|nr:hypothetical protein [Acidobacteriota bacterium]
MASRPKALFHEEQSIAQTRVLLMLAIPPAGFLGLVVWQVLLGHQWGKQPMSNGSIIGWTVFLWVVFLRLATVRLVVDVFPEELAVGLRGFWRARHIPIASIKSAESVTFDPVRDYGGYGIRTTRSGKAYIAKGGSGVRIDLSRGSSLVIGSRRAKELATAVQKLVGSQGRLPAGS